MARQIVLGALTMMLGSIIPFSSAESSASPVRSGRTDGATFVSHAGNNAVAEVATHLQAPADDKPIESPSDLKFVPPPPVDEDSAVPVVAPPKVTPCAPATKCRKHRCRLFRCR